MSPHCMYSVCLALVLFTKSAAAVRRKTTCGTGYGVAFIGLGAYPDMETKLQFLLSGDFEAHDDEELKKKARRERVDQKATVTMSYYHATIPGFLVTKEITVQRGQILLEQAPPDMETRGASGVMRKGIFLQTKNPITILALSNHMHGVAAVQLLGDEYYGVRYLVVMPDCTYPHQAVLVILPRDDGTRVQVGMERNTGYDLQTGVDTDWVLLMSAEIVNFPSKSANLAVDFNRHVYRGGESLKAKLHKYDVFQGIATRCRRYDEKSGSTVFQLVSKRDGERYGDLSGTYINGTAPFAVFVLAFSDNLGVSWEQLTPIGGGLWGREFAVSPIPPVAGYHQSVKVITDRMGNLADSDGSVRPMTPYEPMTLNLSKPMHFIATTPITMLQSAHMIKKAPSEGEDDEEEELDEIIDDPIAIICCPTEKYMNDFYVMTPYKVANKQVENHIIITVPAKSSRSLRTNDIPLVDTVQAGTVKTTAEELAVIGAPMGSGVRKHFSHSQKHMYSIVLHGSSGGLRFGALSGFEPLFRCGGRKTKSEISAPSENELMAMFPQMDDWGTEANATGFNLSILSFVLSNSEQGVVDSLIVMMFDLDYEAADLAAFALLANTLIENNSTLTVDDLLQIMIAQEPEKFRRMYVSIPDDFSGNATNATNVTTVTAEKGIWEYTEQEVPSIVHLYDAVQTEDSLDTVKLMEQFGDEEHAHVADYLMQKNRDPDFTLDGFLDIINRTNISLSLAISTLRNLAANESLFMPQIMNFTHTSTVDLFDLLEHFEDNKPKFVALREAVALFDKLGDKLDWNTFNNLAQHNYTASQIEDVTLAFHSRNQSYDIVSTYDVLDFQKKRPNTTVENTVYMIENNIPWSDLNLILDYNPDLYVSEIIDHLEFGWNWTGIYEWYRPRSTVATTTVFFNSTESVTELYEIGVTKIISSGYMTVSDAAGLISSTSLLTLILVLIVLYCMKRIKTSTLWRSFVMIYCSRNEKCPYCPEKNCEFLQQRREAFRKKLGWRTPKELLQSIWNFERRTQKQTSMDKRVEKIRQKQHAAKSQPSQMFANPSYARRPGVNFILQLKKAETFITQNHGINKIHPQKSVPPVVA